MRQAGVIAVFVLLAAVPARGQTPPVTAQAPARPESNDERPWSFAASAYTYVVPDAGNYVQPSFAADRDWLHVEARYNYEARETGSVWVGYNFSGGEHVTWELTPMLGGVFGDTDGIAPGYRASLSWRMLEFYSEGEYVIDAGDSSESFLYNWSELSLAPAEWFRFGLVTQRTRAYQSDRDIQRGLLLGFSYKQADLTAYLLNPDVDKPTFVLAVGVRF